MKCLIVRKEWLDKILSGEKTWELRRSKVNIRGRIGLIEAGSGTVVGEATLVNSRGPFTVTHLLRKRELHRVEDRGLLAKWNHAWILERAKRYDKPLPYNHPKGAVIWVNVEDI